MGGGRGGGFLLSIQLPSPSVLPPSASPFFPTPPQHAAQQFLLLRDSAICALILICPIVEAAVSIMFVYITQTTTAAAAIQFPEQVRFFQRFNLSFSLQGGVFHTARANKSRASHGLKLFAIGDTLLTQFKQTNGSTAFPFLTLASLFMQHADPTLLGSPPHLQAAPRCILLFVGYDSCSSSYSFSKNF